MVRRIHYITYGDEKYKKQMDFAVLSARFLNQFESITAFGPDDIDIEFVKKNHSIMSSKRGGGYWLWKPYLVQKKLKNIKYGDYIVYSDAGLFFLKNINTILDSIDSKKQDVIAFELPLIEKQWTKPDLFSIENARFSSLRNTNQIMASVFIIKKSNKSIAFVDDWLNLCCNESYISDSESCEKYDHFIDHRHDQSLFSLLYKSYGFSAFRDPTQLGQYPGGYSGLNNFNPSLGAVYNLENGMLFKASNYSYNYGTVFYRCRDSHPLVAFLKFSVKRLLFSLGLYSGSVR
ncbi:hypothetical protein LGV68_18780 [Vibrio sp. LQ2]|uniref:hypothetical protein n=1 Tax=Vibrio TaxID=662 RepID=UPI001F3A9593|nr:MULTISPECIES: hypothetical protein [Vibrio]MCE7622166.1 hypothetical protein [Vibrio fluvialis]UPO64772.1 glycosyl transferase [Vibrio fluvialis]USP05270.1 hypothetical protein LGV68_18780 [Vibrio sp. LQ2]